MSRSYQIKSDLSEKQIEADVAAFFGWISEGAPFRLLDIDEQITGADKQYLDVGIAFFMQFKVSQGLHSARDIPTSTRRNRSKLEDIREFRASKRLEDDPTLYFGLRKQAATATDLQHNILMQYAQKDCSEAFYVAPLHLDKEKYYRSLFTSAQRYLPHPYRYRTIRLTQQRWVKYIDNVPFLKDHVSIVPHEQVTTHKHHYSYSASGEDVAWHSPEIISERPSRLSDMLSKTIRRRLEEGAFNELHELELMLSIMPPEAFVDEHPIVRLQNAGRVLYKKEGIRMFLLLANRKELEQANQNHITNPSSGRSR